MELRLASEGKLNQTSLRNKVHDGVMNICAREWLTIAVDLYQNPSKSKRKLKGETREFAYKVSEGME